MTVDTRGLIDREQLKPFERLVIFQKIDNPDAPWAELQNSVEITSGSVQVALTHFSSYAVDSTGNESNGWQLKFNPPAIGLFSGAATYNYPIQISAGRNGLQPNVVLAYSSRSVDGLVGLNDDDTDGLPPGWALDEISIARNGIKTNWDGANNHLHLPDKFSVTINGTGYDLVPANPTAYCGQYYAKDAAWLYVQRLNDLCRNGTTNYSHEY